MRKLTFLFIMMSLLILSSCSENNKQAEEEAQKLEELRSQYEEVISFNDSLLMLMTDIYNGIDSINAQEGFLYNLNPGERSSRRAEVRKNLSSIKARMAQNKEALADMESKLRAKGQENSVLLNTIEQMKERIAKQDEKILALENDLAIAQEIIVNLSDQVAQSQQIIEDQMIANAEVTNAYIESENQANTVYYAIGTNKELKQNGLLEKKFLGQTKVLRGDFNTSYFTKADKRNLTQINTGAKKVKIWTNMPENTYKIENGVIKIFNPDEFWSLSKYLVIQVN